MTKAEIVQAVYAIGGFSKKESADVVDLVFEMMKETLGRGEKIKISGFGNFVLRDKRQRPGRNPQTGDPIKISERRVLTFKASQILKQALNASRDSGPFGDTSSNAKGGALSTSSGRGPVSTSPVSTSERGLGKSHGSDGPISNGVASGEVPSVGTSPGGRSSPDGAASASNE
jgi:integration host factor subunit alpha